MSAPAFSWVHETEAHKAAVQEQLERVLNDPVFRGSKRSAALLRHVVQCALDGNTENLKERALGVEVFHRHPDYDTHLDPVVRTAAGEVRKRIAQYYHVDAHHHELRIDLPAGSYVPEFRFADNEAAPQTVLIPLPHSEEQNTPRWTQRHLILLACAVVLLIAGVGAALLARPESASERFWRPVLAEPAPILIALGDPSYRPSEPEAPPTGPTPITVFQHELKMEGAAVSDVIALAHITNFLGKADEPTTIRDSLSTSFSDLQHGPNVLIAAFDNPWTLRAAEQLRFRFNGDPNSGHHWAWIQDTKNPSDRSWMVDLDAPYNRLSQDYAIVARFRDSATGQVTVIAAGLAENGTATAGTFLTDPKYLEMIDKMAPKGWEKKNFEGVIGTQVIDGKSGPPRLLAVETW